jgi:hypothetical protein
MLHQGQRTESPIGRAPGLELGMQSGQAVTTVGDVARCLVRRLLQVPNRALSTIHQPARHTGQVPDDEFRCTIDFRCKR